jgi:hypothetical protein
MSLYLNLDWELPTVSEDGPVSGRTSAGSGSITQRSARFLPILNEIIKRAKEIARILVLLQSVATPERRTQRGLNRLIGRD